jgi:serine protease Do
MNERVRAYIDRFRGDRLASTLLVLLTLAVGILIGTIVSQKGVRGATGRSDDGTQLAPASAVRLPQSEFVKIAKQMEPSVVNINTESVPKQDQQRQQNPRRRRNPNQNPNQNPDDDQSPFDDFFDRFFGGGQGPESSRPERALGSGVIVNSNGYILTNEHVIDGADRIKVKLNDDAETYTAKVIGKDDETDLAVIKIEPRSGHKLIAATLGNSEQMEVGDWVLAIGSPFDLPETVTAGIVSAKGRNIVPQKNFQSFIQTDAAINPGNSGGPLVNMNGEVIGINTAIYTQGFSQGYMGIGFAMPSNTARTVYEQLVGPQHRVTRGSIGVQFNAEAQAAVSRVYGAGVAISDVSKGGPADQAGLKSGDVITAVNGHPVKTGDELIADITREAPGSKVKIDFTRNGKPQSTTVTVADRAKLYGNTQEAQENAPDNQPQGESKLGMTVRGITPDQAERWNVPTKGVVVTDVKPGSFADDINMAPGDIILQINRQPVGSESDFVKLTSSLKSGDDVVFLVRQGRGRNAGTVFKSGKLP